jgi:hypothetical protein
METIATKEIAKQVRKELKAAYPSIKFSVTSDWNKISVSYVDGVPESEIKPFITKYRGYRDLDTYGDYGADQTTRTVIFQGQEVETRLDYYNVSRSFSERYMTEVLDYVKATLHGADTDGVVVEVSEWSGNAHFAGHSHNNYSYYCEIARESSSLEPIKVQRDRLNAEKEAKYQEWKAKEEVKTTPISEWTNLVVTPVSVIDIDIDRNNVEIIDCKFPSLNKCQRLDEYIEQLEKTEMYRAAINRVVQLTDEDYDLWTNDLLDDQEWLAGMGGSDSIAPLRQVQDWFNDYTEAEQKLWIAEAYNLAVLVYAPNRSALLVDPQGRNYAAYIGFIEEGLADRYLPKKLSTAQAIPEIIQDKISEHDSVDCDHHSDNVIMFPSAKPSPIEIYSQWVQEKINKGQASKILSFDDWMEIAAIAL